ncbi:MAG: TetR/AcrR family transcriptional regulator [Actinomycetota bacterium]|nr:TetR/AcrR family transcriptional regulator [Actinomycetota bacterium]MDD5666440.1 TetR/AcrR family transcriptional regulator [Actinomycetota bacterium]
MSGPERKEQIVQAAITIMAEHGLPGATTRRIAEEVGVSEPALYKYFPGKKELLLEALDEVGKRFFATIAAAASEEGNVPDRIYNMSATFYEFVMDHPEESMLLFETVTGARDPEIRTALSDKLLQSTAVLSQMFERGKREGSVREDLDITVAAWQILALGITLVFAALTGLEDVLTRDKALLAVKEVLENIVSNAATQER